MSPKTLQALGRVTWQRSVPNSADFMVSSKVYAGFHVFGCFKFRVTFHFSCLLLKWVLISLLIWNGFVKYQNRKKSTIIFGNRTSDVKLGFVKNCLNSITLWLANVTILLFMQMFETWYFCFSHKAKGIQHDPLVFWKLKSNVLSK